jgi:hypothetical protein
MMTKNFIKSETYADLSCKTNDGINCWMRFHLALWEDFSKTIHREEEIKASTNDLFSEYTKSFTKNSIEEQEYISQRDIEELDNNLIELIKNKE